jgi:hypothetical protein
MPHIMIHPERAKVIDLESNLPGRIEGTNHRECRPPIPSLPAVGSSENNELQRYDSVLLAYPSVRGVERAPQPLPLAEAGMIWAASTTSTGPLEAPCAGLDRC